MAFNKKILYHQTLNAYESILLAGTKFSRSKANNQQVLTNYMYVKVTARLQLNILDYLNLTSVHVQSISSIESKILIN